MEEVSSLAKELKAHLPWHQARIIFIKARKRMDESAVKTLFQLSGQRLDDVSPETWMWHNRRVVLVDGSTVSMPDSSANQAVYPQPSTQKKGSVFLSLEFWF